MANNPKGEPDSMEPSSFVIGAAADVSKKIASHYLKKSIKGTKIGDALAAVGLLEPDFQGKLKVAIQSAITKFFTENENYQDPRISNFFAQPYVAREIANYLLDGEPLDVAELCALLADSLDVPQNAHPAEWPRAINGPILVQKFTEYLKRSLFEQNDPALALMGGKLNEISKGLAVVETEIVGLRQDIGSIFAVSTDLQQKSEWRDFEAAFLTHLGSRFSKLTTPGARDLHGIKQDLSVAYISLNVKSSGKAEPIRAERFLRENPLIVVRGPAGSGKTTLLNYVVWSCAQPAERAREWAGGVPFFVPLRTVARIESGPPSVSNLVQYSVDNNNWPFETPRGWINNVLKHQKRGVLMIDGVDELPPARRAVFWEWLSDFCEEYPDARVIVTSRTLPGTAGVEPSAKTEQWNPPDGFVEAHLEEMSDSDIAQFIDHWHNAVDESKLEHFEIADLHSAKEALPAKLTDPANRRIRELCSTPLLCAMVCVLHWREEGYLPRQRVDLYDKCCDMLIEARDLKRQIPVAPGPLGALTKYDKERVLQRLAFEMMHARPESDEVNGDIYRIEISRDKALQWIAPWIPAFHQTEARKCRPEDVLDYLIERTGLLREPASGLVDFPHRTFQEYLAACAAGAAGQEDFLANRADDDQWHETIMLAAGTPTGGVRFGHDLVEALIKRAERNRSSRPKSQRIRKTCFALALGCIENLRQPDPVVRDQVLGRINEIVPPNDDVDAKILAVAGDAAVPHLVYDKWKDERTSTVASCAQALRLIGTSLARRELGNGYINERREEVVAQVCRTVEIPFEKVPYVRERVAKSGELPSFVELRDIHQILHLHGLKRLHFAGPSPRNLHNIYQLDALQEITAESVSLDDLAKTPWPKNVKCIELYACNGANYDWLKDFEKLTRLIIVPPSPLKDVEWLEKSPNLKSLGMSVNTLSFSSRGPQLDDLSLFNSPQLTDLSSLGAVTSLRNLRVERCGVKDLSPVADAPNLERLELVNCGNVDSLDVFGSRIKNLKKLKVDRLTSVSNVQAIAEIPLTHLILTNLQITDLSALERMGKLQSLAVHRCMNLKSGLKLNTKELKQLSISAVPLDDLGVISNAMELQKLTIDNCGQISNLNALSFLKNLQNLYLEGLKDIDSITPISDLSNLKELTLSHCPSLASLEPLSSLKNLTSLSLSNCGGVSAVDSLSTLSNLRSISLINCNGIVDLSPLSQCQSLETIEIQHIDMKRIQVPEILRPKIREYTHRIHRGAFFVHRAKYYTSYHVRRHWGMLTFDDRSFEGGDSYVVYF